jgi:hypothetical protein
VDRGIDWREISESYGEYMRCGLGKCENFSWIVRGCLSWDACGWCSGEECDDDDDERRGQSAGLPGPRQEVSYVQEEFQTIWKEI